MVRWSHSRPTSRGRCAGRGARPEVDAGASTERRPLEPVDWSTRWRDGLGAAPVRPADRCALLDQPDGSRPRPAPSCSILKPRSAAVSTARPAPR